jgi:hypothetical protein
MAFCWPRPSSRFIIGKTTVRIPKQEMEMTTSMHATKGASDLGTRKLRIAAWGQGNAHQTYVKAEFLRTIFSPT